MNTKRGTNFNPFPILGKRCSREFRNVIVEIENNKAINPISNIFKYINEV